MATIKIIDESKNIVHIFNTYLEASEFLGVSISGVKKSLDNHNKIYSKKHYKYFTITYIEPMNLPLDEYILCGY